MASRSLDDLSPAVRQLAGVALSNCQASGLFVLVYCTKREGAEQAALYAQGRTTPGPIVTWAKQGESWHEKGRALDLVPLRNGKPVWGTTGADLALWLQVAAIFEAVGFEWAGRWPARVREFPHFQIKG